MPKLLRKKRDRVIALIIFTVLVIALSIFAMTQRVSGEEELMVCDDCDKAIKLKYENGLMTEVHLIYEWDD